MALIASIDGDEFFLKESKTYVIGRDQQADIPVDHDRISRQHALVSFSQDGWFFKDLSSTNGSFLNGQLVSDLLIEDEVTISLGSSDGPRVTFQPIKVATSGVVSESEESENSVEVPASNRIPLSARTKIGSHPDSEVTIDNPAVEPNHAEITVDKSGFYHLVDFGSSAGSFVNGERVTKRRRLIEGDILSFGEKTYHFVGSALEADANLTQGFSLIAKNLSLEIAGKRLLDNVSFQLKPSSLTAILGPSGAGKSTLLAAMTGRMKAASGEVIFGGINLRTDYARLASSIGFVPQSDLLHTRLGTKEAISYGAQLRFPKGTKSTEISARVEKVLSDLELTERAELRIDQLSGGQRKRASVALELLTEPVLLFLDEPTSGLDPGLDRQVMALLRALADSGKTVVVVTHSVSNLDFADDLILMAAGGKLGYFGSPKSVFVQMGTQDWAEIFELLSKSAESVAVPSRRLKTVSSWDKASAIDSPALQGWWKQFFVLVSRYLKVISSDKGYIAFLTILPFLIAGVGSLTGSKYGLAEGPEWRGYLNLEARPLLLVLILGAAFIGASTSIQELVKERVIFAREKSVGLRVSAYIMSKVTVLSAIVSIQVAIFSVLTLGARPLPESGVLLPNALAEITIALILLGIASMGLGLLASALVETADVTMPILVATTMVQVVLSGAVPVSLDWLLETLGPIVPAYWTLNMLASSIDLNSLSFSEESDYFNSWVSSPENLATSAGVIVMMALLMILMSGIKSRAATPGR
jgi:ABC-type multidrug transport system ATPase subunit/pSer/pThr/pTyr-binding forkhead associated (FHA) protein